MNYACALRRGGRWRLAILTGLFLTLLAASSTAQFYYGKNKVQYDAFEWQVMTTEHFRIFFYQEASELAQIAARIAEDKYPELAAKFNVEIRRQIPLIIYATPGHFQQTNVIPRLLPESVGGFTEFLKGRVVVPFNGSYFDFEHVLVHELVHVFQLSKAAQETERQPNLRYAYPPLWFTEGLAEFWSEGWDTEADMIIKDMVINGHLMPITEFWKVHGTYFMYKLGQSVCGFINSEFGEDKLVRMYELLTAHKKFEEVVHEVLGVTIEELSQRWEYSLKKKYYPEMADYGLPKMEADRLTYDGYSLAGVPIDWTNDDGESHWLAYMAYRRGYAGIYLKPREDNKHGLRTLVKGERSSKFESLYMLRSRIDGTSSGKIAFSSKSMDQDVLYIYSLREMRVVESHRFPGLLSIRSPRFSPDESKVVFTGVRPTGYTDLFVLNLNNGNWWAINDDPYFDVDPTFSRDGTRVIFSSDRCTGGDLGALNLYSVNLEGSPEYTQLTAGQYRDQTPEVTENGIYFSSDRGGSYNLFLLDDNDAITVQSTLATGAFYPRLTKDGKKLLYSGYQDVGYQVYEMDLPERPRTFAGVKPDSSLGHWRPKLVNSEVAKSTVRYNAEYTFDIAQSAVSYDQVYGTIGGLQAMVSDMLGNHAFYLLLTNTAETKEEFFESFNFGVTYVNRARRTNWGVGLYHIYDEYYNRKDLYYYERQAGLVGLFSYPLSKFTRIDITAHARYLKKDRRYGLAAREGFLITNFISFVHDNSLWSITGPIEGRRYNLSAGITTSISDARNYNRVFYADIRHYFRLGESSAFANRLFAYYSTGMEPQRIYFGGSWSFRGYDRREFYVPKILFASNELRFPLIDNLFVGLPFGGLGFKGIRGVIFGDVGTAWEGDQWDDVLGSFGYGFRLNLGYVVVLRFDFTKTTDFETISPNWDFDFFFGWNF